MASFDYIKEPRIRIEKGFYSGAILGAHDNLQFMLYLLIRNAFLYLGDYDRAISYSDSTFSFKKPAIEQATKLGIISPAEEILINRVKRFRDEKVGHNNMFFDNSVEKGEFPITEVLDILDICESLSKKLHERLHKLGNAVTVDVRRSINGEDMNKVQKEHTFEKLHNIMKS